MPAADSLLDPSAAPAVSIKRQRKPRGPVRRRTLEQLERAETLRPADVFAKYGFPDSTLNDWCTKLPEGDRLPSIKIGAWRRRKGVRLIYRTVLDAWIGYQHALSQLPLGEPRPAHLANFAAWQSQQAATSKSRKGRAA